MGPLLKEVRHPVPLTAIAILRFCDRDLFLQRNLIIIWHWDLCKAYTRKNAQYFLKSANRWL